MNQTITVKVPDIGDYKDVPVREVYVQAGDAVEAEQSLIMLESDKATIDIPSPAAGTVKTVHVKTDDLVSEGSEVLVLETSAQAGMQTEMQTETATAMPDKAPPPAAGGKSPAPALTPQPPQTSERALDKQNEQDDYEDARQPARREEPPSALMAAPAMQLATTSGAAAHASPSVRQFARGLGVEVRAVTGSGPKGRITHDDVRAYVKGRLANGSATSAATGGLELLPWPKVDFAKFGPVESKPLSRLKRISAANLHRNWVRIPHVTHNEEADITALEALRVQLNQENAQAGVKVTLLAFLIKAAVTALEKYPDFNASLNDDGEQLTIKRYYHIGFAADTRDGLVVPVIRACDKKGVLEIAREAVELAQFARAGKLKPEQMQGGCFSISSLGGIGGAHFTPIINAPEVAILGVGRSATRAVWDGAQFTPRLILPLSLSYDHRVIDGAQAARFAATLAQLLADFRRVAL